MPTGIYKNPEEARRKLREARAKRIGSKAPCWKGGKIRANGNSSYIMIYNPTHPFCDKRGYVMEHRLVIEDSLDRFLDKKEVVHHINGKMDDNTLSNLHLFKNNSEHIKFEAKNGKLNKSDEFKKKKSAWITNRPRNNLGQLMSI